METIMLNTLGWDKSGCKSLKIPTDDELKALNRLRDINKRVRVLKKELSLMSFETSPIEQKNKVENELIELKKEWKEWEKKRDEAARERMIALGHLEPDQSN